MTAKVIRFPAKSGNCQSNVDNLLESVRHRAPHEVIEVRADGGLVKLRFGDFEFGLTSEESIEFIEMIADAAADVASTEPAPSRAKASGEAKRVANALMKAWGQ